MVITNNINSAYNTGLEYHVITDTEIHSFSNKKMAFKDFSHGKREIERMGLNIEISLLTRDQLGSII